MDTKSSTRRHRHHRHPRSRSPPPPSSHGHHHHHRHRSPHRRHRSPSPPPPTLPFNAPALSRHTAPPPAFRDYLDIQKGLRLESLSPREARGRYKRFVSHYNRGELARGWYERVVRESRTDTAAAATTTATTTTAPEPEQQPEEQQEDDSSEDDVVGPSLPGKAPKKSTVARPTFDDLELQKAQTAADHASAHAAARADRKAERQSRAAALDDLAPRADPGTFARRLEKRADARQFQRAASPTAGEVDDDVLLGGGGGDDAGGTEGFKMKKAALERKKNDRELRKEQLLQARIAEREERMAMHRVKEERTMAMLRALAGRFQ